jgi:ribosome-associated protein
VDSRRKAFLAAAAAETKLADQVMILDLQEHTPVADFFVIASGSSRVQIKAITEAVEEALEEAGEPAGRAEGREDGRWVLLDFGDVVVHIFGQREREFYSLERLWGDVPVLERDAPVGER